MKSFIINYLQKKVGAQKKEISRLQIDYKRLIIESALIFRRQTKALIFSISLIR